ncbi:hypothetical protein K439DRAFT_1625254 [Ramaria rubella]|nr:hypothetical protein K439DRAFT_1625254 [Ramaria rubella]
MQKSHPPAWDVLAAIADDGVTMHDILHHTGDACSPPTPPQRPHRPARRTQVTTGHMGCMMLINTRGPSTGPLADSGTAHKPPLHAATSTHPGGGAQPKGVVQAWTALDDIPRPWHMLGKGNLSMLVQH